MNIPLDTADDKLREIRQMLESGQKNVWLERHTLIIWGITIGLIDIFIGPLTQTFYHMNFWYGVAVEFGVIGLALTAAIYTDFRLTRAMRRERDETVTLVQKRITMVIWMIFLFAFLMSMFAVVKLGGGLRVMGLQLLLAGIVLITLGQFSQRWYTWSGVAMLLYGVHAAFRFQPGVELRIHVSTAFIVGCIFCAGALTRASTSTRKIMLAVSQFLLIFVTATVIHLVYQRLAINPGRLPVMTLDQYRQSASDAKLPAGKRIVKLPGGTRVPVQIRLGGDIFTGQANMKTILITRRDINLVIENGRPTGIYSFDGKHWIQARGNLHIKRFIRKNTLSRKDGPLVYREIYLGTQRTLTKVKEAK